jgi:hypothetical protein
LSALEIKERDTLRIELETGMVTNLSNGKQTNIEPFSEVQMMIYQQGDLLKI